jgi:hypothetical protein
MFFVCQLLAANPFCGHVAAAARRFDKRRLMTGIMLATVRNAMGKRKDEEPQIEPPYWTHDTSLFSGTFASFRNEPVSVRGKVHLAEETYYGAASEIVPLQTKQGSCTYVNLKAYVLVPDIRLTIGLYKHPKQYADQEPVIGEVIDSYEKPKMREHDIGSGQAWYYPADKTIVLWECGFYAQFREHPIHQDSNMTGLWTGFETFLSRHFAGARQIATTHADPDFETGEYQQFLTHLGYAPYLRAKAAWRKALSRG